MSQVRRRVLFVDDESRILEGIVRMLRPRRAELEILTAVGGDEALALLAREQIDVVVSDMRMPRMDGAQLLSAVRIRHPQIVRIILSGQSDQATIVRAASSAHQFLSKPCDPALLSATVFRACALRDLLADHRLQQRVAGHESLPCDPAALEALRGGLRESDTGVRQAVRLVEADLGLSAKMVQLTASSFFGTAHGVLTPAAAVTRLGVEVLRGLAADGAVFTPAAQSGLAEATLRARARGRAARAVAQRLDPSLADQAEVAALLVEAGRIILEPGTCAVSDTAGTACDAGAFLLGLWGLSDGVVVAVSRVREPSRGSGMHDLLTGIVHLAASVVDGIPADEAFLSGLGIDGGLTVIAAEAAADRNGHGG
jgi:CheY-like chemotaxis protein